MNENIIFPHLTHRVYPNTFLQNTVVTASYDKISNINLTGDFIDKKAEFFSRFYNIDQSQRDFVNDGISISTKDKSQTLIFNNNFCLTNVNRSIYKTFVESVLPHVFEISTFIRDVIQLRTIKSISVRKINMFPVIVDKSIDLSFASERSKVMENVLSSEYFRLNAEVEPINVTNAIAPFELKKIANIDGYLYSYRAGILPSQDGSTTKYVVLDITAELRTLISSQDIESRALSLNDNLFDLYHWSVNPEIIEKMQQE